MPRSRTTRLKVIWHDGPEWTDAWFVCRRCPDGFNKYLVEVNRGEPSHRLLPLIEAHFAREGHPAFHGVGDLGTRKQLHQGQLAVYTPPHPEDGASLLCRTCKARGRNPVMLTPPPYGDARRLGVVKRRHSHLALQMLDWPTQDQGDYLNALDQGILDPPRAVDARAALAVARSARTSPPRNLLNDALTVLLVDRTADEAGVDGVITELALLSKTNAIDFSCQVGEGLISLGVIPDVRIRAVDLAERVRARLGLPIGVYPTTSRRTLYRLWGRRDDVESAALPARRDGAA